MLVVPLGVCLLVVAVDVLTPRKKLSAISGVFLGILAGLLAAYALSFFVNLLAILVPRPRDVTPNDFAKLLEGVKVVIGMITCYLGISLVLQTKDDFRFVIPYVEFAKKIRGIRPILLDTSVIIDGRIHDIALTHALHDPMIVPKFILNELQGIADSSDKLRRTRGRRGLDVLQKLQDTPFVDVSIEDADEDGSTVDQMLVALARQLDARIMTGDYNLAKIANLRDVEVININELAKAVRPVVLPGETMAVKIVKPG
ncbi:MAG: PIN/TRAM domain-containing protein, partial [Pirellulaceae bacterium]|nr:PIN/TRAM domain-containing protein [Pirellulaceae bacterium]